MKRVLALFLVLLVSACSSAATVDKDGEGTGNEDIKGWIGGDTSPDLQTIDWKGVDMYTPPPEPGAFGAPCTDYADCDSGFCIEGIDGYICTMLCVEDCPEGYECVGVHVGSDVIFICAPPLDRSCEPCSADLQCSGGKCVHFGPDQYCLAPCEKGCKEGYSCQNVHMESVGYELCVPDSATCECVAESIGLEKACKAKAGTTVCYGVQFCTETGWSSCDLPDEICDGKDNDCNGTVDDGMLNPTTGIYDSNEHCGVCNNSCVLMDAPHATGYCDTAGTLPVCKWQCDDGFHDVNVNPNDGCECEYLAAADDPDVPGDANCDGIDGVVADGVFVAKDGSDASAGTWSQPLLTVQAGIDMAQSVGKPNVYVATGVYMESISLLPGVATYGGYSADFVSRDPGLNQTAIMGDPASEAMPGAVNGIDILDIPTVLSGFHVFGVDATAEGGSSYAVYIRNANDSLRLVNNWVVAGNGRDGTHGADGADGDDGDDGAPGLGAKFITAADCTGAHWSTGGNGGQMSCNGQSVAGGDGGDGVCPDYDESGGQPKSLPYDQSHQQAEWGGSGAGPAPGGGGEPGYDGLIWEAETNCSICSVPKTPDGSQFIQSLGEDGKGGADGTNGANGGGCGTAAGSVVNGLWTGSGGSGGGKGNNGSGGGGGGAGGGVETIGCGGKPLWEYTDLGGSGGGGGSGGCAGDGGEAGKPGGGSFGLILVADDQVAALPVLTGNTFLTGFGGDGGDGGSGGVGGDGGSGKPGGPSGESLGNAWCADAGGHGGTGGRGGHGGGGGGGCGGPSLGVFLWGAAPELAQAYANENEFMLSGAPGSGGTGGKSIGDPGQPGQPGADGATNF